MARKSRALGVVLVGLVLAGWSGSQGWSGAQELGAMDDADVSPFNAPAPYPDATARAFLAKSPGTPFSCTVIAVVDEYGHLLDAAPDRCPPELRLSATNAVAMWEFHPPTVDNVAVKARYRAQFVFVGQSVDAPLPPDSAEYIVRGDPTAIPQWPSPPKLTATQKQALLTSGHPGVRCALDMQVDSRGRPVVTDVVDCPADVQERVVRRMKRYSVGVRGAGLGDGTVYRLDTYLAAD